MKIYQILPALLLSFPAFAVPDRTLIKVNYHPDEIHYIHKNKTVKCSQNKQGGVVLGCARDKKRLTLQIDCANRLILVDVFSTDREIEIHGDLKKDSCEYQEVLDHELTHMDLHADALESVLNQGMSDILDAFNAQFKKGKGCQASTEAASRAFDRFVQKYQKEDKRINQEFDRDDVDSVLQNCKTPPKVNVSYTPVDVKYVSVNRAECLRKKMQCFEKKGKKQCEPIKMLSCTDMPISFKSEIRTYLGQVNIVISAPEIKTKVLSRYQPRSCEYEMLKDFELEWVDEIEEALYDFADGVEPAVKQVYNQALQQEYSGQKLNKAVNDVVQKYIRRANKQIDHIESLFRPLMEQELKNKCERK
ncbi:MAG: hypothetical protein IJ752_05750 [Alphaproteobacteria bacterium]|nr:hypothetical protein [Alphaproteobacteria bacterium]